MHKVFGNAQYIDEASVQALENAISTVDTSQVNAILVLCCEQGLDDPLLFNPLLQTSTVPIFGGIFPYVVYKGCTMDRGMVVIPMHTALEIKCYEDLEHSADTQYDIDFKAQDYHSLLVLVDGLSTNIDHALNHIFDTFGQSMQVFGGGAGSLSFDPKPCLFTPQGVLQDAMIVVAMKQEWTLAIGHGWEALDGPFIANKVNDNTILELNFRPALEVYNEVIEKFTGTPINAHTFFETSATFPFGIERLDGKLLVRDPITLEQSALVCVGTVPENTMLYVLKGLDENLINAAHTSIKDLDLRYQQPTGLLFDCISRKIFLKDDFDKEVHNIGLALGDNERLFGALVLGEIASNAMGGIDLHNKTAITAIAKEYTQATTF